MRVGEDSLAPLAAIANIALSYQLLSIYGIIGIGDSISLSLYCLFCYFAFCCVDTGTVTFQHCQPGPPAPMLNPLPYRPVRFGTDWGVSVASTGQAYRTVRFGSAASAASVVITS